MGLRRRGVPIAACKPIEWYSITVTVEYIDPDHDLARCIDRVEYLEWEEGDHVGLPVWIVPHGGATLFTVVEGAARFANGSVLSAAVPYIVGPFHKALRWFPSSSFRALCIDLRAEALRELTDTRMCRYAHRVVAVDAVVPAFGSPPSGTRASPVVGRDLWGWAQERLRETIARRRRTGGGGPPFFEERSVSERHKQRIRRSTTGLSLQERRRCERFLRACAIMRLESDTSAVDWVRLSIDAGYYDQSHFIRYCKAITGLTPVVFHRSMRAMPLRTV